MTALPVTRGLCGRLKALMPRGRSRCAHGLGPVLLPPHPKLRSPWGARLASGLYRFVVNNRRFGTRRPIVRRASPSRSGGLSDLTRHRVRRYLTGVKTKVSSKGQIVLPAEIRRQDAIKAGQEFQVERLEEGSYRLVRCTPPPNQGVVDWLLDCPQKGFFVPIQSESTDTL
jgi:AbrB family looped-hinge helix DNA binding protein